MHYINSRRYDHFGVLVLKKLFITIEKKMKKDKIKVAVIGAGAAGMMAAIEAARGGAQVTVIERNPEVGKKLATTGNGRCNYTNMDMSDMAGGKYRGQNPAFCEIALKNFTPEAAVNWFRDMGVEPKMRGTYVYPGSDQAGSVVLALKDTLIHLGVKMVYGVLIKSVKKDNSGSFLIGADGFNLLADKVIIATGGRAVPKTGSTGDGYVWAKALGHSVVPVVPALTAIKCTGSHYKDMAGVRTDAELRLCIDGEDIVTEQGELQLVDYGISGIPVFQISRYVAYALREGKKPAVYINFVPNLSCDRNEVYAFYKKRAEILSYKEMKNFFNGLLNQKLGNVILSLAHIDGTLPVSKLSDKQIKAISSLSVCFKAECEAVNPFANAQCSAGGINTGEIDPVTMESGIVKGLYFAGEILDIDGICGGYNLQWAWSSGYAAGRAATWQQGFAES